MVDLIGARRGSGEILVLNEAAHDYKYMGRRHQYIESVITVSGPIKRPYVSVQLGAASVT
jgi:rRNA processing protein Gar1